MLEQRGYMKRRGERGGEGDVKVGHRGAEGERGREISRRELSGGSCLSNHTHHQHLQMFSFKAHVQLISFNL